VKNPNSFTPKRRTPVLFLPEDQAVMVTAVTHPRIIHTQRQQTLIVEQPDTLILRNPQVRQGDQRIKRERPQPPVRKNIVRHNHKIPARPNNAVDLVKNQLLRLHKPVVVRNIPNIPHVTTVHRVPPLLQRARCLILARTSWFQ